MTQVSQHLPRLCPSDSSLIGCIEPSSKTTFSVVDNPTPLTTISAALSAVDFVPGQTTTLIITNSGDNAAANIEVTLPSELSAYLDSGAVTSCASTAAGATCTLELPMTSSLPSDTANGSLGVTGTNTNTVTLTSSVTDGLVSATGISFSSPGSQSITVTNNSSNAITGLGIALGSGSTNVSLDAGSGTCTSGGSLAASSSCTFVYSATANSYGQATRRSNPANQERLHGSPQLIQFVSLTESSSR